MVAALKRSKQPKNRNACHSWPLVRELAVQTMYITDGMPPKAIAAALSTSQQPVTCSAIRSLIIRRGWTAEVRNKARQATAQVIARTSEHVTRVVNAQAAVAEAASIGALKRALDATQSGEENAARDFRSWAGGARDLVNVMRQARGLVDAGKGQPEGSKPEVHLSFFLGSQIASGPLPAVAAAVQPVAIDVAATVLPAAVNP